ncbi:Plant self-incompatibility S1 [Spatholobus suberectus]|nr:Plant self-incompatibility S1 [Spatholobus suberectus]
MASTSKIMFSLSMLLTVLVALQLKGSESGVLPSKLKEGFLPSKVTVEMSNNLTLKQLDLHCKDKHNDLGPQTLNVGDTYSFRFRPNAFANVTLYFCRFVWVGAVHYFDIYVQERDTPTCDDNRCSWQIFEEGPCKIMERSRECFKWNEVPIGRRQLVEGNNILPL